MSRLLDFLKKNYAPLGISFLLALLLWIAVITDKNYTRRIAVPLKINRVADGYALSEIPPSEVIIEVSGTGRALIGLNFYQPTVDLDFPELTKSKVINLKDYQSRFKIPRNLGIEVVDIVEPRTLDLRVDRFAEQEKTIRVTAKIKPKPGHVLSQTVLSETTVKVSGPVSKLNSLTSIFSDSIQKKEVTYPFTETLDLINPFPGITTLFPDKIVAHFEIEQLVERTIYNIPIQLVGVPQDFSAAAVPPTVTIRIKGSEKTISAIEPAEMTALFSYRDSYETGRTLYPVKIELPENVELLKISPEKFRLTLKRSEDDF